MKKYFYLAYDLACICISLVAALYLRHGFPLIIEGQPNDIYILLLTTLGVAVIVLPAVHNYASIWRFTSSSELFNIMIAVALVVLLSNSGLFLISRLEMMPRSVPPMHWALAVTLMCGSRLLTKRLFRAPQSIQKKQPSLKQHVLVLGVCHTAELYLQFIRHIVQHPVVIEGFVDSDRNLTNWMFQKYKILGTPHDIPRILEQFNLHGVHIKHVVLMHGLNTLPKSVKKLLKEMENKGTIELVHFSKHIGSQLQPQNKRHASDFYQHALKISPDIFIQPRGIYPYIKRSIDIVGAICLAILFLPLLLITTLLVFYDVGAPILFWQQRPGLRGRAFRLYKFRTMQHAGRKLDEDRNTHKSADSKRTSAIGKWIRRFRWDELPQIFHIIAGTMSFVGPRPLLPDDQPMLGEARLSVRPGVTGWAQIHGGDALTPQEKLGLDLWYIQNMSFWLDLRILLATFVFVLKEDKYHRDRLFTQ